MNKLHVVVDLQFGSTGKGALAGFLGEHLRPDTVATAWGPNAGHTYIDADGFKFVHTQLANSMVCKSVTCQLIGPGSVVNMDSLMSELERARGWLDGKTIVIHPNACVVTDSHRKRESELVRIGSTMKGTAAATMDKMWRDPEQSPLVRSLSRIDWALYRARAYASGVELVRQEVDYNLRVDDSDVMLVEGAQGFSLGVHTHFWPHTTSRDVSVAQLLADCRLPIVKPVVWGTMRTYPIRVANRFNDRGEQVGTSGPCYDDQFELDWQKDLKREPELTTVTRLPRRIFSFSVRQIEDAVRVCRPAALALTFCDYVAPRPAYGEELPEEFEAHMAQIQAATKTLPTLMSFGPSIRDMVLLNHESGSLYPVNPASMGHLLEGLR